MSISGARLADEKVFQNQVKIQMVKVATKISGENNTGYTASALTKRQQLCNVVFQGQDYYKLIFSNLVVTNPVIDDTSGDGDIEFTINLNWDEVAGVLFSEKIT